MNSPVVKSPRAIVVGGSLGGLFSANLLRQLGWEVDVYERSAHQLDSRGGGLVLQPEVVEVFQRLGTGIDRDQLGVRSENRLVINPDGQLASKYYAPQTQTSWALVYSTLRQWLGAERYHQGKSLSRIEQQPDGVTAFFDDGSSDRADLLIGADGGNSMVRQLLWPEAEVHYAGYFVWRGLIPETAMSPLAKKMLHGDFAFANNTGSHALGYLVPGLKNDLREGHRLYNWVWYRLADDALLADIMTDLDGRQRGYFIPEGKLAPKWLPHIHAEAEAMLPQAFVDVIKATPEPFAQAIRDLAVDSMVSGRVVLLGDAAAIPRPHTGYGSGKAAANALALADALESYPGDIDLALARWQPGQVSLGKSVMNYGIDLGDPLMFNRPARRYG